MFLLFVVTPIIISSYENMITNKEYVLFWFWFQSEIHLIFLEIFYFYFICVGFMPQNLCLYDYMTANEILNLCIDWLKRYWTVYFQSPSFIRMTCETWFFSHFIYLPKNTMPRYEKGGVLTKTIFISHSNTQEGLHPRP